MGHLWSARQHRYGLPRRVHKSNRNVPNTWLNAMTTQPYFVVWGLFLSWAHSKAGVSLNYPVFVVLCCSKLLGVSDILAGFRLGWGGKYHFYVSYDPPIYCRFAAQDKYTSEI